MPKKCSCAGMSPNGDESSSAWTPGFLTGLSRNTKPSPSGEGSSRIERFPSFINHETLNGDCAGTSKIHSEKIHSERSRDVVRSACADRPSAFEAIRRMVRNRGARNFYAAVLTKENLKYFCVGVGCRRETTKTM